MYDLALFLLIRTPSRLWCLVLGQRFVYNKNSSIVACLTPLQRYRKNVGILMAQSLLETALLLLILSLHRRSKPAFTKYQVSVLTKSKKIIFRVNILIVTSIRLYNSTGRKPVELAVRKILNVF